MTYFPTTVASELDHDAPPLFSPRVWKNLLIALTSLAVFAVFGVLAIVWMIFQRTPDDPRRLAVAYAPTPAQVDQTAYCAGETLVFTPTLTILRSERVPGDYRRINVLRVWKDAAFQNTVLRDGTPAPRIEPKPNNVRVGTVTVAVRVPVPDFNPGRYYLTTTTASEDGPEGSYDVGINVLPPEACRGR